MDMPAVGQYLPAGQSTHVLLVVMPEPVEYLLGLQVWQAVCAARPVPVKKVPAEHFAHTLDGIPVPVE